MSATATRTTAFDRKLQESYRLSDLADGIGVSYRPTAFDDSDRKGSTGNLFAVSISSDVTSEVWLDWREAVRGNLSLALCARLMLVARDIETRVETIMAAEGLSREAVERQLARLKERYGE